MFLSSSRTRVVCIKDIWFPATYTGCNGIGSGLGSNVERGFDDMGILCVSCVYDTIGNRCFEKTSFPIICTNILTRECVTNKMATLVLLLCRLSALLNYFLIYLSLNYGVYTVRDSTFAKYSLQCKAILKNIFVCFAPTHQSQFG